MTMYSRILVTGIPSYLSNTITGIDGLTTRHSAKMPPYHTRAGFMETATSITNTGNYLIGEGAIDSLPREETTFIPFWHLSNNRENPEFWRDVKANFDVLVFTAANLIRSDLSADMEAYILERVELPIVILGIGIQRCSDLESPLPEGTQRFIRILAERDAFVFTRGEETATYLKSQGVRHARASGCPSMFYLSRNVINAWKATRECRVTPSSRLVFSGYFGAETHVETARDMNYLVDAGVDCAYVLQDEMVTYGLTIEGGDEDTVYDLATGRMISPLGFPHQEKIHANLQMHCFFDCAQWRAWMSHATFSLQRRFHGSMMSLQAGVPSIMIALDDRMKEMLNFIGFPYLVRQDWVWQEDKREFLNSFMSAINVDAITDQYAEREANFRSFLREAALAP